ncbi:hypothetical protein ACJX0J_032896, partial [Zea mays]
MLGALMIANPDITGLATLVYHPLYIHPELQNIMSNIRDPGIVAQFSSQNLGAQFSSQNLGAINRLNRTKFAAHISVHKLVHNLVPSSHFNGAIHSNTQVAQSSNFLANDFFAIFYLENPVEERSMENPVELLNEGFCESLEASKIIFINNKMDNMYFDSTMITSIHSVPPIWHAAASCTFISNWLFLIMTFKKKV